MEVEYVHFYLDDAFAWRSWFVDRLGFCAAGGWQDSETRYERVYSHSVRFLLSSALANRGPVAAYLAQHPPGVVDVAFRVERLQETLVRAKALGATLLPGGLGTVPGGADGAEGQDCQKQNWAVITGWGDLRHTLIEGRSGEQGRLGAQAELPPRLRWPSPQADAFQPFQRIDHLVLNVAAGDMAKAVDWYGQLFGLRPRQSFHIQTAYSGLRSQVLVGEPVGPDGANRLQLPINEPESATSQIQDFLNHNQGPGIQHIALLTPELLPTVARLRRQEINFLNVPSSYYEQLSQRPKFDAQGLGEDWLEIATQQVLVDWHLDRLEGPLLQIFTQPIFAQPTFFFELIERRKRWLCQLELRAWESEAAAAEVVEAKDMRGVGLTGLAEGMLPLSPSQGSVKAALDERSQSGCAEGFGEGNFQALFEAIEREQRSRERVKDCQSATAEAT